MNNFNNLFEAEEQKYDSGQNGLVKNRIWQTLGTYKFLGQIVDVYLPAMVSVIVSVAGGKEQDEDNNGAVPPGRNNTPPPPGIIDNTPPQRGPGGFPGDNTPIR
jgi:hypothetical protein